MIVTIPNTTNGLPYRECFIVKGIKKWDYINLTYKNIAIHYIMLISNNMSLESYKAPSSRYKQTHGTKT